MSEASLVEPTVGAALDQAAPRLAQAGVEDARRDARLLLAAALGLPPEQVFGYPERRLNRGQVEYFQAMVARRTAREPLSRILGRREFWGLELSIDAATLDPRPETETLVEALLARCAGRDAPLSILDLGTGSGCLLLALLSELPSARGLGLDRDPAALAAARRNARALGLDARAAFVAADWAAPLTGSWQAIVSNPPYIRRRDMAGLAPEVACYEPHGALDGGDDGLDAYRTLAPQIARFLAPKGIAALEIGCDQAGEVAAIVEAAGLVLLDRVKDLAGHDRCLLATRMA